MPWPYDYFLNHPGKAPVTKPPSAERIGYGLFDQSNYNPPPDNGLSWLEVVLLFLGSAVAAYCLMRAYMGDC